MIITAPPSCCTPIWPLGANNALTVLKICDVLSLICDHGLGCRSATLVLPCQETMPNDGSLFVGDNGFTASNLRSNCSLPRLTVKATGEIGLLVRACSATK